MKNIKETLGIDVSKCTLDTQLHVTAVQTKVTNDLAGFKKLLSWALKSSGVEKCELLVCFEHTGMYSIQLATFLEEKGITYCMMPAIEIKRSLGMVRGKDDQVDAKRIAHYAHIRRDTLKETKLPTKLLKELKALLSLRGKIVAQKAGYKAHLKELKRVFKRAENKDVFEVEEKLLKSLTQAQLKLEKQINKLINSDPEVKRLFNLITSIKGVGPIVGANLIVVTQCFKSFEKSRQLACYCGVAPFKKQSGTSIKGRSRVSHYANKKMKALLNLAASSAVGSDKELKAYYQRRIEKGKSKMSTLNIVRNKLLHRVFAVVKRGTPYVETYQHKVNFC